MLIIVYHSNNIFSMDSTTQLWTTYPIKLLASHGLSWSLSLIIFLGAPANIMTTRLNTMQFKKQLGNLDDQ